VTVGETLFLEELKGCREMNRAQRMATVESAFFDSNELRTILKGKEANQRAVAEQGQRSKLHRAGNTDDLKIPRIACTGFRCRDDVKKSGYSFKMAGKMVTQV
jgi:hypothetical protein